MQEKLYTLYLETFKTPVGTIATISDKEYVYAVEFGSVSTRTQNRICRSLKNVHLVKKKSPLPLSKAITAYFKGDKKAFKNLKLKTFGTAFQQSVWRALQKIPHGKTACYQDIAKMIKNPKAVRAVGLANNNNPIAIVIPCHRVIGKNASLTGYAGGLKKKEWLLHHEGAR